MKPPAVADDSSSEPTSLSHTPPTPPCNAPPLNLQPQHQPSRSHRTRWITLLVLLVLAAWFARFAYLRITVRPSPRPEYWEARIVALDPPADGALTTEEAAKLLASRDWLNLPEIQAGFGPNGMWRSALTGPWDDKQPDVVGAVAAVSSTVFDDASGRLRESLQTGWRPYVKIGQARALNAWLGQYYTWATWFLIHSRWSREQGRAIDVALKDWLDTIRLGREASRTRFAHAQMYANRIYSLAACEMMFTARERHDPIDTHGLASTIDRLVGPPMKPSEMFEGERLCMQAYLEDIYAGGDHDWLVVSEAAAQGSWWNWGWIPVSASRLWNLTSPVFHDKATARRAVDTAFTQLDSCDNLVTSARWFEKSAMRNGQLGPGPLDGVLYSFGGDSPDRALMEDFQARTALDAAMAMLALAEYARERQRYPDSLDDLVPRFLPRLPIDCTDRQPLRYRRIDADYLLYSIGHDGKDNGGNYTNPVDENGDLQWFRGGDITFSRAVRPRRGQS